MHLNGCGFLLVDASMHTCATSCESICQGREPRALLRPKRRLAIIVAGLKNRFYPLPLLRHVVGPAAKAGWEVDLFVSLCTHSSPRFNHSEFGAYWYKPTPNPRFTNYTTSEFQRYFAGHARYWGAHRTSLFLRDRDHVVGSPPKKRRFTGISHERVMRSALRLWSTEVVWRWMQEHGFKGYDVVMVVREDVYFVDDVDPSRFTEPNTFFARGFHQYCRVDPIHSHLVDDRVLVFGRAAAPAMLNLLTEWYTHPSPRLDSLGAPEVFFGRLAKEKGLAVSLVPGDWLPFFAALHMRVHKTSLPMLCFRDGTTAHLVHPQGPCVSSEQYLKISSEEPDALQYVSGVKLIPFCEEFPLL
mmetsp:Transcript_174017/g.557889  ORF Transcript_174017/g.557889 Transcript_174017/m.557889 type:complete len:357 (+) Transcript_174017:124-1194(+)